MEYDTDLGISRVSYFRKGRYAFPAAPYFANPPKSLLQNRERAHCHSLFCQTPGMGENTPCT